MANPQQKQNPLGRDVFVTAVAAGQSGFILV
jgi:hypothetical protein